MPNNEATKPMDTAPLGIETMNIYKKLSAIAIEITNVNKNLSVGVGKSSYKATGEADVLAAVRPTEAKYHVYSYPVNRKVIESSIIETVNSYGEAKKQIFERIETTYRFVNMDKPEEFVDIMSYGDGLDTGDKSVGKAMTYADKYALLKAYKIITGEDPDQAPSPDQIKKTPAKPKQTGVSDEVKKECEALGITLERIAAKKNMKVEDLTDDIIKPGLVILKQKQKAKKEAAVAAQAKEETPQVPPTEPVVQHTADDDWIGE